MSTRLAIAIVVLSSVVCTSGAGAETASRVVVSKSSGTMLLMNGDQVLKTYKVALSRVPVGPKVREGDHKVREGQYVIDSKNAHSRFHLALHISYPNAADRERAKGLGVRPGGNIEIHGLDDRYAWVAGLHRQVDWTDGCVAVTNGEIEEIWAMVPIGRKVDINRDCRRNSGEGIRKNRSPRPIEAPRDLLPSGSY